MAEQASEFPDVGVADIAKWTVEAHSAFEGRQDLHHAFGDKVEYTTGYIAAKLADRLTWTSEVPTEAGWYWYLRKGKDEPRVVHAEPDGERLCAVGWGVKALRGRWSGPLPTPSEPNDA